MRSLRQGSSLARMAASFQGRRGSLVKPELLAGPCNRCSARTVLRSRKPATAGSLITTSAPLCAFGDQTGDQISKQAATPWPSTSQIGEGGIRTHGATTPTTFDNHVDWLRRTSRWRVIESCWPLGRCPLGWVPRDVAGQTQRDRCLLAVNCKGPGPIFDMRKCHPTCGARNTRLSSEMPNRSLICAAVME